MIVVYSKFDEFKNGGGNNDSDDQKKSGCFEWYTVANLFLSPHAYILAYGMVVEKLLMS